jgi:hypothetical protein
VFLYRSFIPYNSFVNPNSSSSSKQGLGKIACSDFIRSYFSFFQKQKKFKTYADIPLSSKTKLQCVSHPEKEVPNIKENILKSLRMIV